MHTKPDRDSTQRSRIKQTLFVQVIHGVPFVRATPIVLTGALVALACMVAGETYPRGSTPATVGRVTGMALAFLIAQAWLINVVVFTRRTRVRLTDVTNLERSVKDIPASRERLRTVSRRQAVFAVACMLGCLLVIVLIVQLTSLGGVMTVLGGHIATASLDAVAITATAGITFSAVFVRRLGAVVDAWPERFSRCPACGYDLSASPASCDCPECSRPYAPISAVAVRSTPNQAET